jgi:hypothetical protein
MTRNNFGSIGIKWSTVSGAYHSILSLELSRLTNNDSYAKASDSICRFALKVQQADGRFITNPDHENITFIHPYLYACEGLIYAGTRQSNESHHLSRFQGLRLFLFDSLVLMLRLHVFLLLVLLLLRC